jgi:Ca-activated chloride channel family protein
MSFLAPLMFAFALALPVIVALYLLKLKRQRVEVPSTLLWLKSIQDLTANAPFQRLRNNLLLWLQLLAAALVVFALARPFLHLDTQRRETVIVLLDNSASMQAKDVRDYPSRLEQARAIAHDLIDNLGPDDTMLPVTFNSRAQTLVSSPTGDKRELRRAIDEIRATDQPTDIRDALTLVRSLTNQVPNPEVVVISDGALGDETKDLLDMAHSESGPQVRYLRCGAAGENVGIVAFNLSRALEDQSKVEIYAEALNSSSKPVDAILELLLDGERIDAKHLALAPEQSRGVVFSNVGDIAGALTVRINTDDELAVDNEAHGILSPQRPLRVLLVSERDNPFITQALLKQDALELSRTTPGAFDASAAAERADLVILDGFVPATLPEGNYMIFAPKPLPLEGFETRPRPLEFPPVVDWDRRSAITRFADFGLLTIKQALDYTPPADAQTLIETTTGPLVTLIERGPTSILYGGFDLYQSDWPWLVSFPVFLTNVVELYRGRAGSAGQFVVPTGQALMIPIRRDTTGLRLTTPDHTEVPLVFAPGTPIYYYTNTDKAGIYTVRDDQGRTIRYAASLLSPAETAIMPAQEIGRRGEETIQGETEIVRANAEIWQPLAWVALIVLCLEWFIYLRRAWV